MVPDGGRRRCARGDACVHGASSVETVEGQVGRQLSFARALLALDEQGKPLDLDPARR